MSMLTSQVDRLRAAADQFDKVLCGKFDAIEPSTISPMMREAADTIENLRGRLTEQMCELQKAPILCTIERYGVAERYGVTEWRKCSACGSKVLADPVRYCPSCGRKVDG